MVFYPNGEVDARLVRSWGTLAGIDEVGRGALAGPVAVGVVVIDSTCISAPSGIADSKALSPLRRKALVTPIQNWAKACAVGWASPTEVCEWGMSRALRTAALRGLHFANRALEAKQAGPLGGILLDGHHDFLSAGLEPCLFETEREGSEKPAARWASVEDPWSPAGPNPPVATMVKADRESVTVAAASILAKVARDRYMSSIADPGYGWEKNKGYASAAHQLALHSLGANQHHRKGWNLPGLN